MMNILVIETATHACSAALWSKKRLFEQYALAPREHSERILPQIDTLLTQGAVTLADIDVFAFGSGPGSFMGLRLAAGVTQGLAFSQNRPVVPISTLQMLAQSAYDQLGCDRVLCAWDARMHEVYFGQYVLEHGLMQPQETDRLVPTKALKFKRGWTAIGNAWSIYCQQTTPIIYPHAKAGIKLALASVKKGQIQLPSAAIPHYVRYQVATPSNPFSP